MKAWTESQFFGNSEWIREVLNASNIGLWSMIINQNTGIAQMYASSVMLNLMGLDEHPSPEDCFTHLFSNVDGKYVALVEKTLEGVVSTGQLMEVQYLWDHPKWGKIYIRCAGKVFSQCDGVVEIRGYHQNVSELTELKLENIEKKRQLELLEKEKNRYNMLFESVMCGIAQYRFIKGNCFIFKNANQAAIQILGYSPDEFWGRKEWDFTTLVVPEDLQMLMDVVMARLKKVGDKSHFEYRLLKKDKTSCWIIGCLEVIIDVDGEEVIQSVFLDIDDSKKAEFRNQVLTEQVSAGNELLRLSLEHTLTCEYFYYPEERVMLIPRRTREYYGCKGRYENMPFSFAHEFIDENYCDIFVDMYEQIHRGEKTASAQLKIRDRNQWCRATLSTISVKEGRPAFVVGIVEDISKEKNIEKENVELHAIYDYIMNNDYDLMSVGDLEKQMYTMRFSENVDSHGVPSEGSLLDGNRSFIEKLVCLEDQPRVWKSFNLRSLSSQLDREGGSFYFYYRSSDSLARFKEAKLSFFNGARDYLLLTVRDIHDMRIHEERVRQTLSDALMVAEKANNAKSDFLSKMSHDMRTPMNGIMGLAMIAKQHLNEPPRIKEYLSKISMASNHLLGLINDVLDMSKIDSGKIVLAEERFNLVTLLQDVLSMVIPDVKLHRHVMSLSVGSDVHPVVVGDTLRLKQVFLNILSNAIKFSPDQGHIGIEVSESDSQFNGFGCYRLAFTDNGIGMSEVFLEKIFIPFEREDNSMTSKVQGTGLGMPISKAIVEMMNGSIDVQSEPGKGSTFTVTVHLKQIAEVEGDPLLLRGLSVILVDDDVDSHVIAALSESGMAVSATSSAREALSLALESDERDEPFFAMVVDLKDPDIDALELTRRLRVRLGDSLGIVMVSADRSELFEREAKMAGVDYVLSRPVTGDALVSSLAVLAYESRIISRVAPVKDFTGKRILLVEDNELNLEIASEILKMMNVIVEPAEDGLQAVNKIKASPEHFYDLVFMDVQMPVMDGYEAVRQIRKLNRADVKFLPVIAMTANAFPEDVRRAREAGMNEHIAKPIDLQVLYTILNRWLKQG